MKEINKDELLAAYRKTRLRAKCYANNEFSKWLYNQIVLRN